MSVASEVNSMQKTSMGEVGGLQAQLGRLIVRSKLVAPSAASRLVERKDIAELVARSVDAKLVLFRAPAGFGKTTAMRQYYDHLQASGQAVAWLTLDSLDDDFRRLITHVVAAFDLVLGSIGSHDKFLAGNGEVPDINQLAFDLVDSVAACEHPFTLFIDEFESVTDRSIDDLLRLILSRLPAGGQLAIASREVPNLQLGRLRAQRELVEVDQFRLRFSREETDFFLRTLRGVDLSEKGAAKLYQDTEGWPAALWLAAMALENRESPESFLSTFSGSYSAVAEYLVEDVLSRQSAEIQSFLLKTSILDELNKSLCDAVCGRSDSEEVLKRLEQSNVCVTTLDAERNLYRYHGLFLGFLRVQLDRIYPKEIPHLHLLAAKWYEAEERPIPAINHALASGATDYALSLIVSRVTGLLFQGRFRLLARWLDSMPVEAIRAKPRLRIAHIWTSIFTRRSTEALERLNALGNDNSDAGADESLANEINAIRPYILATLDRHSEGYWLAEDVIRNKTPSNGFAHFLLATTLAIWRVAAHRYSDAIELLVDSNPVEVASGKTFPSVYTMWIDGLVSLTQGRVREAIAHFRVALSEAEAAWGSRSIGRSIAAIYLAESLYDIDDIEEAEQLLALHLPIVREYVLPDALIISHVTYARIAHDRGDIDHCYRNLSELEYFGRQNNLPRIIASAQLERARIALLKGDISDATSQCERAANPEAWANLHGMSMPANDIETIDLCRFRLFIYGRGEERILESLKAEIRTAQHNSRFRRVLKLKIILAKALHMAGQIRLAMRTILECAQTASRDGLVSTFLEEGPPIIELLRELRLTRKAESQEDENVIPFIDQILSRAGYSLEPDCEKDELLDASVSLSSRELRILEALTLGLSNNAMAEKFFVTESTVRSHLRKINVKLGAGNRTQAVNIARRLGLIR